MLLNTVHKNVTSSWIVSHRIEWCHNSWQVVTKCHFSLSVNINNSEMFSRCQKYVDSLNNVQEVSKMYWQLKNVQEVSNHWFWQKCSTNVTKTQQLPDLMKLIVPTTMGPLLGANVMFSPFWGEGHAEPGKGWPNVLETTNKMVTSWRFYCWIAISDTKFTYKKSASNYSSYKNNKREIFSGLDNKNMKYAPFLSTLPSFYNIYEIAILLLHFWWTDSFKAVSMFESCLWWKDLKVTSCIFD